MAKASGEKAARRSGSLMRLGSVRDLVLARVPLDAHRALGQTCKALRRLVYSDDFSKLRKTLGCEECGLLVLAKPMDDHFERSRPDYYAGRGHTLGCVTHNLVSLGFAPPDQIPVGLEEFTTALSADGYLIVCGDANHEGRNLLIYDTREHAWVQNSRFPDKLPISMYGQCTAFLDNTLVVVAGGNDDDGPWGFSWDEQLRMWQSLPPVPTAVTHPGYGIIGSRLFLVGGYAHDETHAEHYGGGDLCDYSARLQIFDMTTRTWSLGPPLDALRDRLEQPRSAAVYNGRLYVFCQRVMLTLSNDEMRDLSSHAYCFDPRSNSWSELPPLPVHSESHLRACVHNGRLVILGTMNDAPAEWFGHGFDAELHPPSTFHYEWDDDAETWTERPLLLDDISAWPGSRVEAVVSVPLRIR